MYELSQSFAVRAARTRNGWTAVCLDATRTTPRMAESLAALRRWAVPASELRHPLELAERLVALHTLHTILAPSPCPVGDIVGGHRDPANLRPRVLSAYAAGEGRVPAFAAVQVRWQIDQSAALPDAERAAHSPLLDALQVFPPASASEADRAEAFRSLHRLAEAAVRVTPAAYARTMLRKLETLLEASEACMT
jgi:hypothetical protein